MKRKAPVSEESDSESEASTIESDEELLEAFENGELQPGLNAKVPAPRKYVNNAPMLKEKLKQITLKLEWIERLDLTTKLEPIVDGILTGKEAEEPKYKVETPGDKIVDDLQRETLFYRQAQSAIIEGLARLKALGVPTRRPEDYFAQMAKSDDHMLKVKRRVLTQQVAQEKSQQVKKLRELKKYGKKVQVEVGLQRAKEKRELLSKVKQYREGKLASLDFLDEKDGKKKNMVEITKQKTKEHNESKRVFQPMGKGKVKRQSKDNKFGFGGKKKGSKKNNVKSDSKKMESKPKKGGARPGQGSRPKGGNKSKGGARGGGRKR
nr:EOG090X0D84 [Simocephalus serrulatus]